jgi:hypothetical protein
LNIVKKIGAKLGGGIVVILILGSVAAIGAFHYSRDWHHRTVGAWFPDDTQVLLARPLHLPFNNGRTIDIWRVSLKDGKATSFGNEQVGGMHDLYYLGVSQQRMWFLSYPSETLINRGARTANDRYNVRDQIKAHPTLASRFEVVSIGPGGPIIKDQRGTHYIVQANGTFTETTWYTHDSKARYEIIPTDWARAELTLSTSEMGMRLPTEALHKLPYVRTGVMLDANGKVIRPREGGWLAVGEQLDQGFDTLLKHVVIRLDDKGNTLWQRRLMDMFEDTAVDDFTPGPHYRAQLLAMHTTPQRVWVVMEVSISDGAGHETRVVELDGASGKVLRSMVPRL